MNTKPFEYINPCGNKGLKVIQIKDLYSNITLEKVKLVFKSKIKQIFN